MSTPPRGMNTRPSAEMAVVDHSSLIERTIMTGDLSRLTPTDRTAYYMRVCESIGVNPLTRPFDYMTLNGKQVLYARRDCTDQLRRIHAVSTKIVSREVLDDLYIVTVEARTKDGRTDESMGAVAIGGLKGEPAANAMMKAETKAKRRATLALCGLGLLDETEVATMPEARFEVPGEPAAQAVSP